MICLVIGASEESVYAIELARKMGHYVIAFDGNKDAAGLKCADESHVVDIRNAENIYEKIGDRHPDMVLPTPIGRILVVSGQVNDHYALKGVSLKATDNCTDKYEFHKKMQAIGMRDAQCILFKDISQESEVRSYPMILKPRFGAGSRGIFMINNEPDLHKTAALLGDELCREDYILESLVDGEEYGIDGACFNGKTQIILLRKKLMTAPPERQCTGYISVKENELKQEEWNKLNVLMDTAVKTMEIENSVFHADILKNSDGFFMIEMSARPSGHHLHNLFTPLVTGVSVIEEYIKFQSDAAYCIEPHYIKKMMICYFDFEDCVVHSVPAKDYIMSKYPVIKWECTIKNSDVLGKIPDGHSVMGRGFFIIKGEDDSELIECRQQILNEFMIEELHI